MTTLLLHHSVPPRLRASIGIDLSQSPDKMPVRLYLALHLGNVLLKVTQHLTGNEFVAGAVRIDKRYNHLDLRICFSIYMENLLRSNLGFKASAIST